MPGPISSTLWAGSGASISRSLERVTKGCGRSREKRRPYGQAEGALRCRVTYARRPAAVTSTSPPVMSAVRRLFIHRLLRIFGGGGCNHLKASERQSIGYFLFTRVRRRG